MITIISGTGRPNSNTKKVANNYQAFLQELNIEANVLDLEWMHTTNRDDQFIAVEKKFLIPAEKFIIITPEYNGSIPGLFKLLIDISDIKNAWYNKKILLTGVSSGRAGNNRGMDNLTNIFNYLKAHTFYNKIPLSQIENELTEDGLLKNASTIQLVKKQLEDFINF
ncbi:MAG: NAD(P)H-dependent oxidoreductase [Chitinophagaceae bacterium]|jgi:NAD(P)H-dependent FMN reductase|nr:NAD(P)H-dependent oxidoreductase [Chitinophagaceae bacterium]